MQNFKFILSSIIVLILLSLVGYWAVATLEPGSVHAEREKRKELEKINKELEKEIKEDQKNTENKLKERLALLQPEVEEEPVAAVGTRDAITTVEPEENQNETSKYQSLIDQLQKMAEDKVSLKEKSKGTRVGAVQTFLNIYNNTSKRVDNDYGASTKAAVADFQKKEGLTADGQVGPSTLLKMIAWLENNS